MAELSACVLGLMALISVIMFGLLLRVQSRQKENSRQLREMSRMMQQELARTRRQVSELAERMVGPLSEPARAPAQEPEAPVSHVSGTEELPAVVPATETVAAEE